MSDSINLEKLASMSTSLKPASKFESLLSKQTSDQLEKFVDFLVCEENKTMNTARSYKSYVAKALVTMNANPDVKLTDMSTDIRSAVNALNRFLSHTSK